MNILRNNTEFAFHILKAYLKDNTTAIDCTLGNGFDTIKLLEFGVKTLYAFDIQKQAIDNSKKNIKKYYPNYDTQLYLIQDSHSNVKKYTNNCDIAIFNLGFLPLGDKKIFTSHKTTLMAVKEVLDILNVDGICLITMYSGHKEGLKEKEYLLDFASKLCKRQFHVGYMNLLNQPNNPPEILCITKKTN